MMKPSDPKDAAKPPWGAEAQASALRGPGYCPPPKLTRRRTMKAAAVAAALHTRARLRLRLLGSCLVTVGSLLSVSAHPTPPFQVGILQQTPAHLIENREAGANTAILELGWNQAEPKPGVFADEYFETMRTELRTYRDLGYRVALDLGFQYPPPWIFEVPHGRYVNQTGHTFHSEEIGVNVPNAVFNQQVRDHQQAYVKRVFTELGTDFTLIRLGWMKYGELAYPLHRDGISTNLYWAFDDLAQGRAEGLPQGIPPCPVPGWTPGSPSPGHQAARQFLEWYLDALKNYHDWQIATVRSYTPGPVAMLYPSWGTRPGALEEAIHQDLAGTTSPEINGEVQRGLDFARLVNGIRDTNVVVYCTWLDSSPEFSQDDGEDPTRWSPARYLAALAADHAPPLARWGENTGGGDDGVLDLCADRIRQYRYSGFFWAFERDLYDGSSPEMEDFARFVQSLLNAQSPLIEP